MKLMSLFAIFGAYQSRKFIILEPSQAKPSQAKPSQAKPSQADLW